MIANGELFGFSRTEKSLYDLRRSFVGYCLGINFHEGRSGFALPIATYSILKYTKSVKERVDELIFEGDIPEYMQKRYL